MLLLTIHDNPVHIKPVIYKKYKIEGDINIEVLCVLWRLGGLVGEFLSDHVVQFYGVGSKFADSLGQLGDSHLIFIVHPAENLLIHLNLLQVLVLCYKCNQNNVVRSVEKKKHFKK